MACGTPGGVGAAEMRLLATMPLLTIAPCKAKPACANGCSSRSRASLRMPGQDATTNAVTSAAVSPSRPGLSGASRASANGRTKHAQLSAVATPMPRSDTRQRWNRSSSSPAYVATGGCVHYRSRIMRTFPRTTRPPSAAPAARSA
jgi:hypothetical protein